MPGKPARRKRRRVSRGTAAAIAVVLVVLVVGSYYGYTTFAAPRNAKIQPVTVTIPTGVGKNSDLNFSPTVIDVVVGVNNTVVWVNEDNVNHTVEATHIPNGAGNFTSEAPIAPGQSFTVTLTMPGVYQYHDSLYPAWMQGAIIVKRSG